MTVHDMFHSGSIEIGAASVEVYDTIRQLDRMGEWSPENDGGRWVSGDGSRVGDQFEGDNRRGEKTWSVVVTVDRATPGSVYAFHTGPTDGPYVQWTYTMAPSDTGTELVETWDVMKLSPFMDDASATDLADRKGQIERDIAETLANIKAAIEN